MVLAAHRVHARAWVGAAPGSGCADRGRSRQERSGERRSDDARDRRRRARVERRKIGRSDSQV